MPLATTLRLLAKARGLSPTDLATAIPRVGAATVSAWLRGEKMPGRDQLDARTRPCNLATLRPRLKER